MPEIKRPNVHVVSSKNTTAGDDAYDLCQQIKELIYSHEGRLLVPTAIGVLEIAKQEILEEQRDV